MRLTAFTGKKNRFPCTFARVFLTAVHFAQTRFAEKIRKRLESGVILYDGCEPDSRGACQKQLMQVKSLEIKIPMAKNR